MIKAATKRKFLTPALAAVALAGGLAAGGAGYASPANAEAASVDAETAREIFHSWSCSACHALADASAAGGVGPTLDNAKLTRELIIDRIANGQGAMPSFGGQMTDEEIAQLADYIVAANQASK